MRIAAPGTAVPLSQPRTTRAAAGAFRPEQPADTPRSVGVRSLSGLILGPEPVDPDSRRRRAMRQGHRILDVLDDLKVVALGACDGARALAQLAAELGALEVPGDERLAALLDQVRIRGEVELAKAEAAAALRRQTIPHRHESPGLVPAHLPGS